MQITPTDDTIAAIATGQVPSGIGVVRISGPEVPAIAKSIVGTVPPARHATHRNFRDSQGEVIDNGIALYFPAPHSFTGEDVLELQGHGGPVVLELLLQEVITLGARHAEPGEFSKRAFLNGKIDLTQAEAIADLITSHTSAAARSAQRSLQGAFSQQVNELLGELIELRTYVEAAIDFPEEEIDFLADEKLHARVAGVVQQVEKTLHTAEQGCLLRDGITLVLAGRPNVGKSSLLNQLTGRDAAIVTDIPGTTRDVLRDQVQVGGVPVQVLDTAGLRLTHDKVEQEGVARAWGAIDTADVMLLVVEDEAGLTEEDQKILDDAPGGLHRIIVRNKVDLTSAKSGGDPKARPTEVRVSAKTGDGVDALLEAIKHTIGIAEPRKDTFIARRRHLDALRRAHEALVQAQSQFDATVAGELLAEDLRCAQQALSEITGEFTTEDLLGEIFSSFCIGK